MAKCDEGYLCQVCGQDVASITDSDLYLRYVLGQVDPEVLHTTPERHLRCNPLLAQFIRDERFPLVVVEGPMSTSKLDPEYVRQRTAWVTRGYARLWEIRELLTRQEVSILDFPLSEFRRA